MEKHLPCYEEAPLFGRTVQLLTTKLTKVEPPRILRQLEPAFLLSTTQSALKQTTLSKSNSESRFTSTLSNFAKSRNRLLQTATTGLASPIEMQPKLNLKISSRKGLHSPKYNNSVLTPGYAKIGLASTKSGYASLIKRSPSITGITSGVTTQKVQRMSLDQSVNVTQGQYEGAVERIKGIDRKLREMSKERQQYSAQYNKVRETLSQVSEKLLNEYNFAREIVMELQSKPYVDEIIFDPLKKKQLEAFLNELCKGCKEVLPVSKVISNPQKYQNIIREKLLLKVIGKSSINSSRKSPQRQAKPFFTLLEQWTNTKVLLTLAKRDIVQIKHKEDELIGKRDHCLQELVKLEGERRRLSSLSRKRRAQVQNESIIEGEEGPDTASINYLTARLIERSFDQMPSQHAQRDSRQAQKPHQKSRELKNSPPILINQMLNNLSLQSNPARHFDHHQQNLDDLVYYIDAQKPVPSSHSESYLTSQQQSFTNSCDFTPNIRPGHAVKESCDLITPMEMDEMIALKQVHYQGQHYQAHFNSLQVNNCEANRKQGESQMTKKGKMYYTMR